MTSKSIDRPLGIASRGLPVSGLPSSNYPLSAIWGSSSDDIWAMGATDPTGSPVAYHYDGTTWSPISLLGGYDALGGGGPDDVWAVNNTNTTAVHWDGVSWTSYMTPANSPLFAIAGLSPDDVWATTNSGLLHWNGATWEVAYQYGEFTAGPIVSTADGRVLVWQYSGGASYVNGGVSGSVKLLRRRDALQWCANNDLRRLLSIRRLERSYGEGLYSGPAGSSLRRAQ